MKLVLFLLYCIPAYIISYLLGQLVMDGTKNVFAATGTLGTVFTILMLLYWFAFILLSKGNRREKEY